jgi:hypothetical protein
MFPVPVKGLLLIITIFCVNSILGALISFGTFLIQLPTVSFYHYDSVSVFSRGVLLVLGCAKSFIIPAAMLKLIQKNADTLCARLKRCLAALTGAYIAYFVFGLLEPLRDLNFIYRDVAGPFSVEVLISLTLKNAMPFLKICLYIATFSWCYASLTPGRCASDYKW